MGVGPLRGVLTGATARRAVRPQVFSRIGLALAMLWSSPAPPRPWVRRHRAMEPVSRRLSTARTVDALARAGGATGGTAGPDATDRRGHRLRRVGAERPAVRLSDCGRARALPVWFPVRRGSPACERRAPLAAAPVRREATGRCQHPCWEAVRPARGAEVEGPGRRRALPACVGAVRDRHEDEGPGVGGEVPHPCKSTARCNAVGGDRRTHTMAVTTFERAGAKFLFVAGTDRGATAVGCPQRPCSADVAHEGASMFEAVHEMALVSRLSLPAARVYQPHGFMTTRHPPSCRRSSSRPESRKTHRPGSRRRVWRAECGGPERRCERCLRGKGAVMRPGRRPTAAARRPRGLLASGRPSGWVRRDHERPGPARSRAHPGS